MGINSSHINFLGKGVKTTTRSSVAHSDQKKANTDSRMFDKECAHLDHKKILVASSQPELSCKHSKLKDCRK